MSSRRLLFAALLCLSFGAIAADPPAASAAADPPIRKLNGNLVDAKGRALYFYDGDKIPGRSACNSQCRLLWPPILAEVGAKPKDPFDLAQRDDGSRQWALRGRPLYRWKSDKKFGDAGGDGVNGVWHLVKVGSK
jgi:predicted lipoprotein with Yx(FWY)xxD motif